MLLVKKSSGNPWPCRLAAVASVSRQLVAEIEQQEKQSTSCLTAIKGCLKDYRDIIAAADDGSLHPSTPGTGGSGFSAPSSPFNGGGDTTKGTAGEDILTSGQLIRLLRDHNKLRDHIVENLASHLGKLEKVLVKGSSQSSGLARKSSMVRPDHHHQSYFKRARFTKNL